MGRVDDIARRFSLAGVLDENARAREKYPIVELDVASIADHPDNGAYSMDGDAIRSLADSIRRDGLTDIPLVRRMEDGSFQMISGHRRKAAFALLAAEDDAFSKIPCRIIEGISDEESRTLLHTANYFTRELTVMERARATQALGIEVKRMREADPGLKGGSRRRHQGRDHQGPDRARHRPEDHRAPRADRPCGRDEARAPMEAEGRGRRAERLRYTEAGEDGSRRTGGARRLRPLGQAGVRAHQGSGAGFEKRLEKA